MEKTFIQGSPSRRIRHRRPLHHCVSRRGDTGLHELPVSPHELLQAPHGRPVPALDLPVERSVVLYSGAIIAGLLVLEAMLPRLWCRVLCPVGRLYGIFNKISLLRLSFAEGKCARCNICDQVCYMGVEIARHTDEGGLRDSNCIYCGRCVEGCETRGKLVKMTFRRK
ncbi:MAG: 4Fe-4S binding protein [Desulfobacterales bacterium]|nr:4Fe-4S binding protein [Desulfobacterales bacterium]